MKVTQAMINASVQEALNIANEDGHSRLTVSEIHERMLNAALALCPELAETAALVDVEREMARIEREKAQFQFRRANDLQAKLDRVRRLANAQLALDGFDMSDTPFHLLVTHQVAWEAIQPGDLGDQDGGE